MVYALFAPEAAMMNTLGVSLSDPAANLIVRSWGSLVSLMGVMMIVGALVPKYRTLVVVIAGTSKSVFVGIFVAFGSQYLGQAAYVIALDVAVVLAFAIYLYNSRGSEKLLEVQTQAG